MNTISKCSKMLNTFLSLFSNKKLVFRAGIHKMDVRIPNRKTLIRLLLQKQSDLGLCCLSKLFCQGTIVENFRTFCNMLFTIHYMKL